MQIAIIEQEADAESYHRAAGLLALVQSWHADDSTEKNDTSRLTKKALNEALLEINNVNENANVLWIKYNILKLLDNDLNAKKILIRIKQHLPDPTLDKELQSEITDALSKLICTR